MMKTAATATIKENSLRNLAGTVADHPANREYLSSEGMVGCDKVIPESGVYRNLSMLIYVRIWGQNFFSFQRAPVCRDTEDKHSTGKYQ